MNYEFLLNDWITTDLHQEIIQLYPSSASEKECDTGKHDDQAALIAKATIISPKGCMFASLKKQLDQVAKLLFDVWAKSRVHGWPE
jgi:hypothetical protein